MLPGCCPSCGFAGEIEAFLVDPEARRAIARVAALEPGIGKLIGPYLRLFGTGKRGLQLRRAVKLIDELATLVDTGDVCRDERVGVRRPATPAMWAAGMEQMVASPPSGALQNHHYLRAIVFGLADAADAQAEKAREEQVRHGRRQGNHAKRAVNAVAEATQWVRQQMDYGAMSPDDAEAYIAKVRAREEGESHVSK